MGATFARPLPFIDDNCHCPFNDMLDAGKVEAVIMKWSEEHPEPKYPTWDEWYTKTFPNTGYQVAPCPNRFGKECDMYKYHSEIECANCRRQPIPAEIAEKLGIKPIGGDADA